MGKKKKKALPMTEEEKIAFEEQKRLAEEEAKKKREDVLAQFLKDKLSKEEKAAQYNMNKLNYQWRNIMREDKAKELVKDIEILSQTFERVIDSKDAVIKSLFKDIAEAEEQYAVALRCHLQNIDFLRDLQKSQLETLTRAYALELEIVCQEFDLERSILVEQHFNEMGDIADILFAMIEDFEERENEARAEFQSMQDEIKNKNLEDKHALKIQLEYKVEDLWQQFRQALQSYNEMNEERKNSFESLKLKDAKNTKEIELQLRKLQRITDQITQIRIKMSANAKESENRNKALKEDKEKIQHHFQVLKAEMTQIRDQEREKLTKLTMESNAAIKETKRKKKKGEMILRLAEMCRKLETEEEKVLPFYASSVTEEELEHIKKVMSDPPAYPLSDIMHECAGLENFWKRYNKVLLDKLSLEREKMVMTEENYNLRTLLKQYLDGISVNDEILSQLNPLLVVNNKTNLNKLNVPVTDLRVRRPAPKTIIEAAHIIQHTLQ
uniref:Dynein regulatory complex subunit 2 n=1 Tax=Arion vulgaris TaxID=1028688 RepID=A0A0B7A486_9EUPU